MSVIHNDLLLATDEDAGYKLTKSLRLRRSASANLSRTPASAGNRKTWTASFWMKRGEIVNNYSLFTTYTNTDNSVGIFIGESLEVSFYETSRIGWVVSNAVFRDISAWYHIVVTVDTTQSTASNRIKAFINGSQLTSLSQAIYPSQNADLLMNSANQHRIGMQNYPGYPHYFDGYLSEFNFIDGQALTPSSFGEINAATGVWKPKAYSGTYGTNGFYLPFTDVATTSGSNAGLGKDFSGNGNYWNTNNISVTSGVTYDSMKDVPTLTDTDTANYPIWNPLLKTSGVTYSNGNLYAVTTSNPGTSPYSITASVAFPSSGKFYWEVTITKGGLEPTYGIGTNTPYSYAIYRTNGSYLTTGMGASITGSGSTFTTNDVIGFAYDVTSGTLSFYKNGTAQSGGISSIPASTEYFAICGIDSTSGDGGAINFGQRPFAYTPPTGFKALNTYNLE